MNVSVAVALRYPAVAVMIATPAAGDATWVVAVSGVVVFVGGLTIPNEVVKAMVLPAGLSNPLNVPVTMPVWLPSARTLFACAVAVSV